VACSGHKDSDKAHVPSYHKMVRKELDAIESFLDEKCKGNNQKRNKEVIDELNEISAV
jgi:hypothetical protein